MCSVAAGFPIRYPDSYFPYPNHYKGYFAVAGFPNYSAAEVVAAPILTAAGSPILIAVGVGFPIPTAVAAPILIVAADPIQIAVGSHSRCFVGCPIHFAVGADFPSHFVVDYSSHYSGCHNPDYHNFDFDFVREYV